MKKSKLYSLVSVFFFSIGVITIFASLYYHLNKEHVGLAFALPPVIYFALKRYIKKEQKVSPKSSKRLFILFITLFLLFISLSLWYWYSEVYHRPIGFFALIAIAYVAIAGQIFLSGIKKYVPIILLEIFLIAVIVRGSVYFEFPTVYGNDPFFHVGFIQIMVSQGSLPSQLGIYINFPYIHLLTAFISELSGLSLKNAYFLISIIEVSGLLFVFLIGKKLGGIRLGLLSAMLITLAPYNILWGFWIIAMTLGMVFFMIILYLWFKKDTKSSITISWLLVFFCLSLIFVHTGASFVTLVTLSLILVGLIIYKFLFIRLRQRKGLPSFNLVTLFSIALFSYWMYATTSSGLDVFSWFSRSLIVSLTKMDAGSVGTVTLAPELNYASIFLYDLPFTLLLSFGILGSLYLINHKFDRNKFALIFSSVFLVCLVYAGGFLGNNAFLPSRWFSFIEIFLVILGIYGMYSLIFTQKTLRRQFVVSSIIIFVFAFSAITTPLTNTDSPFYAKELGGHKALLDSEIIAADFIHSYYNGTVAKSSRYVILEGATYYPNEPETYAEGMIVLRNYDLEKGFTKPLYGAKGKLLEIIKPDPGFIDYLEGPKYIRVYDNSEVRDYIARG